MSLVIKSLNKLKSSKNAQGVPPSLTGAKRRRTKKILYFLTAAVFVAGGVVIAASVYMLGKQAEISKEARKADPAPVITARVADIEEEKPAEPFKTPAELKSPDRRVQDRPASLPKTRGETQNIAKNSDAFMQETVPAEDETSAKAQEKKPANTETAEKEQYKNDIEKYMRTADKETIAVNRLIYTAEEQAEQGDFASAAETYGRLYKKTNDKAALHNQAVYLAKAGLASEAAELVETSELTRQALAAAAIEAARSGKTDTAVSVLSTVENPNGELLSAYGHVYELSGNLEKAEEYHRKAYTAEPLDAYFAYGYARILDVREKYAEALKIYKIVLELEAEKDLKSAVEKRVSYLNNLE